MRSQVEALLRAKKLDRTLMSTASTVSAASTAVSALSREERDARVLATGWASVDRALSGGLPRGECSEIVGSPSSGRTALVATLLAEATRRGEIVALVDTLDRFDPRAALAMFDQPRAVEQSLAQAPEAPLDLSRLLWVRGTPLSPQMLATRTRRRPPRARDREREPELLERVIERALKSFGLIAQSGGFGVVVLDVGDVPMPALRRLPFTTWFRLQRLIEGSQTVGLVLAPEPIGRSARGVTVRLGTKETTRVIWTGTSHRARVLTGFALRPQVLAARRLGDHLRLAAFA